LDRRTFIQAAALSTLGLTLGPAELAAMGPDDRFTVGLLDYGPHSNPRPSAIRRLLLEVEKRTSILVSNTETELTATSSKLFEQPFVVLGGDRRFEPFSEEAILNLRSYLQAGGFLLVDSSEGVRDGPFMQSVRREIGRIFPNDKLSRVPRDHVLYKSFYLIEKPVGRVVVRPDMEGVFDDDRLAVVISHNDLMGAWARDNFGSWKYECTPGGERQREYAYRLGINLVMYALCINYKADQVHVPFILRRRKWKVE
jgi:hypothetical protein